MRAGDTGEIAQIDERLKRVDGLTAQRATPMAQLTALDGVMPTFEDSGTDARELRANLYAATKKSVRTVIGGKVYILHVRVFESSGEDAFEVSIDPAPKLDPSVVPPFTAKQGQYLAFIYNYTKIHCQAPAESDLERYFQVSPPAIHDMIKSPRAQRPYRKNPWSSPIHSPPCTTGAPAAIGVARFEANRLTRLEAWLGRDNSPWLGHEWLCGRYSSPC